MAIISLVAGGSRVVRLGRDWLGVAGEAGRGAAWRGWSGSFRHGRHGVASLRPSVHGSVWQAGQGQLRRVLERHGRQGLGRLGSFGRV